MLVVYGAYGATGRRIAELAAEAGVPAMLAGRDEAALLRVAEPLGLPTRRASLDARELDTAFAGAAVVVSCVAPYSEHGAPVLDAALRVGAHYVDCTGEPRWVHRLGTDYDERARDRGCCVVPAAGAGTCSNIAACLAVQAAGGADDVAVAYRITAMRPSPGTARSTMTLLGAGCPVVTRSGTRFLTAGTRLRRFPNGTGTLFPLTDPLAYARMWPGASTSSYLQSPVGPALAPPLAAGVLAARLPVAALGLEHLQRRRSCRPGPPPRGRFRMTAVARHGASTSVATADVPDVYDVTGRAAFFVAQALLAHDLAPGVRATGEVVGDPRSAAGHIGIEVTVA